MSHRPSDESAFQPADEAPEIITPVQPDAYVNEQDLAMYAAITGRRPVMQVVAPPTAMTIAGMRMPEPASRGLRRMLSAVPHRPHLSVWIRRFSHQARRRIEEARYRLAG